MLRTDSPCPALNWYVIHCKPLRELQTAHALREDLDLEVYVPQVRKLLRGPESYTPFFRGYSFLRADLSRVKLSSINSTPGVLRLLDFGGGPQALPDEVVDALRQHIDGLNREGGLPAHIFRPGDHVLMKSGPFKGLSAIFTGPTTPSLRVEILLTFLGRPNNVKVDVEHLSPLQAPTAFKGERGTRGGSRKINRPPAAAPACT